MAIRTVFSMVEGCARGERQGWLEFVRDFGWIARSLLAHYFPGVSPVEEQVVAVFQRAGVQGGGAWFAGLSVSNEREFMMAFRDLVFACGREQARQISQRTNPECNGEPGAPALPITLEQLHLIMRDFMLLERELLWLFIKGYSAERVATIMMNAVATAEAVQSTAAEKLQALLPGTAPGALAQSAPGLMELAEQAKTDSCVSLRSFNNLVNGQISWRDREAAEAHMKDCFYCIDRFTTFQEMARLRKDAPPLSPEQVEAIVAQLPLAPGKPRGMLARWFAGR